MPEGDWREVRNGKRRGEIEERRGKGAKGRGGEERIGIGKEWKMKEERSESQVGRRRSSKINARSEERR